MATADRSLDNLHRTDEFRWLARLGYAARGVVYVIIGGFAVLAALGNGGGTTDSKGALVKLLQQPLGSVLLAAVALGLAGYSCWRLIQAVKDVDHHGTDLKGWAVRAGLLVSGITHAALTLTALELLLGMGGGNSDSQQDWTATLLRQPAGKWLVAAVGLAIIGAGIAQIVKGWQRRYRRYLKAPAARMEWIDPVSRFGLIARGVVFTLIGGFFVTAAYYAQPERAEGLGGALRTLQEQPYGAWLLLIVAAGLLAFAVYSFIEAVYRRIA